MKKILCILLISCLMIPVCAGCGKKLESENNDNINNKGEQSMVFEGKADAMRTVVIDGENAIKDNNRLYEGMGYISANNSSRLLIDYKEENPDAYWEILNYVFGADGLGVGLYKLELGADVDSSSGTEPAVKRDEDETADVTRGAGYMLAADALTINPELKIDMLYWGLPAWVDDADDDAGKYAKRYQWYKETIDAMYDTYGIKLSYLTVGQNERAVDPEFIKYVANALENETDERYDYGTIQIVAGEGVGTWNIADDMLEDDDLLSVVDVITSHYTSFTSDNTKELQLNNNKKVWFSEGSSPMKSEQQAHNREESASGIGGLNGMLDIASRITQAMTEGMTLYEFQPLVSSYYSGATYFPKQLITANEPWSGAYSLDAGYYMTLHFSRYIKNGWQYIENACYGDGVPGGDGHAIVDSTFNYITCTDPDTGDYSTVIVNNSEKMLQYDFVVKNTEKAGSNVYFRESVDEYDGTGDYYDSFFRLNGFVKPEAAEDGSYKYSVMIKPYSMVTLSTLDIEEVEYSDRSQQSELLELPYEDDFEYAGYSEDYLIKRGMAPRYTTDQAGAFEVVNKDGNNVLMQKITCDNMPTDWGSTSTPVTTLLDDKWHNYSVSIDAWFDKADSETGKYVGIGARYNLASNDFSGYMLKLSDNGNVVLKKGKKVICEAEISSFDSNVSHNLKISVVDNKITAYVDEAKVIEYTDEENVVYSGRVSIISSYHENYFDNLKVVAESEDYSITRVDDMDESIKFSSGSTDSEGEGWYFNTISSYTNYSRTVSRGSEGDSFEFSFDGTSFGIIGKQSDAVIKVEVDGEVVEDAYACTGSADRTASYTAFNLEKGIHNVKITINEGTLYVDAVEYR